MTPQIKKYRLRENQTIVGYAEETENGVLFTGKFPSFWLNGQRKFNQVDRAVGVLDKLCRMVYENDIVSYKINHQKLKRDGVVLWNEASQNFGIFDLESKHFTYFFAGELMLFEREKVEIISHLFNHPHLENQLGF